MEVGPGSGSESERVRERVMVYRCERGVESDDLTAALSAGLWCCSEWPFCPPAPLLHIH